MIFNCVLSLTSYGQFIPLDNYFYSELTQDFQKNNNSFLSAMKPILMQDFDTISTVENILYSISESRNKEKSFIHKKLFNENLLCYKSTDFRVTVDPLFNFGVGKDFVANKNAWINSRGLVVTGLIDHSISFSTEI